MVTDGPAFCAAAVAVLTKSPAPMMAPIPKATNDQAVKVLFNPFSDSDASANKVVKGFDDMVRLIGRVLLYDFLAVNLHSHIFLH